MDFLKSLFKSSNTWDQYKLIAEMRRWQDSKYMPMWSSLPKQFTLSSDFWDKVERIHRYTEQDGKEHAISVWSIYNQIIVTEITRGDETTVTTNDRIQVKFELLSTKKAYLRRLYVNDKEIEKTTIPFEKMPKNSKDSEMRYLFNVHTHPPHKVANMVQERTYYSYFSQTDINSLLTSNAIATGLVTDKVTFLFKTRNTPTFHGLAENQHPDEIYLRDNLRIAEYEADFKSKLFVLKGMPEAIAD